MYFGSAHGMDFAGLDDVVRTLAPQLDKQITTLLNQAEDVLVAIPLSFDGLLASE